MITNFQQLFNVTILHSYFEGDICTCLQFVPAASTAELIQRYKFRLSQNINGFQLYTTATIPVADSLNYIKNATSIGHFEFDLINNDPAFYCFTTLPMNWMGQLQYNSNSVTMLSSGVLQLNQSLSDLQTTTIAGTLRISFDDLIAYNAGKNPLRFEISYTARSTQWQYYIVNRNDVPMDSPSIKGKNDITFDNGGSVTIATGETALLFSSDTLLPLSKLPHYKFDLVNAVNGGNSKSSASKIIYKNLPTPDPMRISTVESDSKTQVSSPIYIYV